MASAEACRRIITITCRLVVGCSFILSSWTKLVDIEGFGAQILGYRLLSDSGAAVMVAWFVAILEGGLGVAFLSVFSHHHLLHGITTGLLLAFSTLLAYAWLALNLEDCGCFGTALKMSPQVSILKNMVLLVVTGISWHISWKTGEKIFKSHSKPALLGIVIAVLAVFSAIPVSMLRTKPGDSTSASGHVTETNQGPYAHYIIDSANGETLHVGEGERFIAVLSATCDHCIESVPDLNETYRILGEGLPVAALCLGDETTLEQFRRQTNPEFPISLIPALEFFDLIGSAPPRFVIVRDGTPMATWDDEAPSIDEILGALESFGNSPTDSAIP